MGVNAYFAIRFVAPPTERQIKQLRYHLIHRFGNILEWHNNNTEKTLLPLITIATEDLGDNGEISAEDQCLYEIDTMVRFYGDGYERGPGLEITALLLYLCRRGDISVVYYGGDGRYREYSEADALELFDHWLAHGNLPYRKPIWEIQNIPECPWCEMPMSPGGGDAAITRWWCDGCGTRVDMPNHGE